MASFNPTDPQAAREAANWFAQLGRRAISNDALKAFYAWRRKPAHDAAYSRLEALWAESGRLRFAPEIQGDIAEALARGERRRRWRALLKRMIAPAGALALAGLAGLYLADPFAAQTYRTAVGEQRLLTLADGSRVRLDTDSALTVHLGGRARDLRLVRGQAFFDVAHDPGRPFIVEAAGVQIRALGTRFDVRLRNATPDVTLVEGRLEVTRGQGPTLRRWRLAAGDALAADAQTARPRRADLAQATSWTTGQLVFQAVPLAEAVAEANRYGRTKLVLEAPALAASRVTGRFEAGDTLAFAGAVCDLFDLTATPAENGEIRLRPRA